MRQMQLDGAAVRILLRYSEMMQNQIARLFCLSFDKILISLQRIYPRCNVKLAYYDRLNST